MKVNFPIRRTRFRPYLNGGNGQCQRCQDDRLGRRSRSVFREEQPTNLHDWISFHGCARVHCDVGRVLDTLYFDLKRCAMRGVHSELSEAFRHDDVPLSMVPLMKMRDVLVRQFGLCCGIEFIVLEVRRRYTDGSRISNRRLTQPDCIVIIKLGIS